MERSIILLLDMNVMLLWQHEVAITLWQLAAQH